MGTLQIIEKINTLPALRQLKQNDITVSLIPVLNHCYNLAGQKVKPEDIQFASEQLSKTLFDKYQSLTLDEVYLALKNGMQKEYGEYYGLNSMTFAGFVKAYNESEERLRIREAKIKQRQLLEAPKELTELEKNHIVINGIIERFEDFKKNGFVQDLGNIAFMYLGKIGLIKFTREYKDDVMMRAELQTCRDASVKLALCINPFERNYLKDIMDDPHGKAEPDLQVLCRNIALNDYFKKLINEGVELTDILRPIQTASNTEENRKQAV